MHTREETSKSKLDASTPVFGKDSQWKIADWLFMVETSLKVKRIPDDMKLMVVAPFLRGTAFQMLKRFILENRTSWNEFRNELLTANATAQPAPRRIISKIFARLPVSGHADRRHVRGGQAGVFHARIARTDTRRARLQEGVNFDRGSHTSFIA